jgi:hypothetical protein
MSLACLRSTTVALAVIVVLLLLVLIISLVVMYIKHRRIYSAYAQVTFARTGSTRALAPIRFASKS